MASSDPRPGTKGQDPKGAKVEYREITSRGRRPIGGPFWLALLLVPILLMWLSVAAQQKRIEKDLGKRSIAALADKGYDNAAVHFEGRDGTVGIKDLNSQQTEEVKDIVSKVSGVRVVAVDEEIIPESASGSDDDSAKSDGDSGSESTSTSTDEATSTSSPTSTSTSTDDATSDSSSKSAGNFTLEGDSDEVTVRATVADKDAQEELIKAVEAEVGDAKVVDKVKISKDADAVNAEAIASLASEVADVKGVTVTADSSEIVLEGEVKSETIKDDIEAKAKAAAGDREVDNKLTVADEDSTSTSTSSPTSTSTTSPSPTKSSDTDDSDSSSGSDPTEEATEDECADISKSVAATLKKQKINFVSSSAKVDSSSMASLKKIATQLKPCVTGDNASSHSLQINGYTDDSGNAANNKQLSARRAASVASVLSQYGIPKSKMKSTGFGESNPVASNDTVEGRKANRRVEILWK